MLNRRSALCSLALVSVVALAWTGCEGQKQTELIAGVSTQVQVPRDLRTVRLDINVGGSNAFCQDYAVYNGTVQLPRTLGTLPRSDAGQVVTISVSGFTDDSTTSTLPALSAGCTYAPQVGAAPSSDNPSGKGARVLRISRQPYSPDSILFVPMPLKFACYDVDCGPAGGDQTCKAGRCMDSTTSLTTLATYTDALIYGTDGTCFGLDTCFNAMVSTAPLPVDDSQCLYAFPGAVGGPALPAGVTVPSAPSGVTLPADGLNVRVTFDGGLGKEILDLDKDEGFFIPDATKPQIFQLAPGLCDLVHGTAGTPHRITGIEVNPVCRPKLASQSICAADQLAIMGANPDGTVSGPTDGTCTSAVLTPVSSAVEFVIDPTKNSTDFLGAAASLLAQKNDPALASLQVGVQWMPADVSACPTNTNGNAPISLSAVKSLTPPSSVGGTSETVVNQVLALDAAYTALGASTAVNKSVVVIANKGFTPSPSCADPAGSGTLKSPADLIGAHPSITTTIVEVGSGAEDPCDGGDAPSVALKSAVTASGGKCNNGSGSSTIEQADIIKSFIAASTCTYVQPSVKSPDAFTASSSLLFSDPTIPGSSVVVVHSSAALSACRAGGVGWAFDGTSASNIVLCKDSCNAYQNALQNAATLASAATPTTPKLPTIIPIFALSGSACTLQGSGSASASDGGASTTSSDASAASSDAGATSADSGHGGG